MSTPVISARRRPHTLTQDVVEALRARIRAGQWAVGDKLPTEAAIMAEFGVSRTVVREALSQLQASGWVQTRHGIGTFVLGTGESGQFRIAPEHVGTLRDVIAVLELRIGVESEAAALAAVRRTETHLRVMHEAQTAFARAIEEGTDAVAADRALHMEIARASHNPHFLDLMQHLGDVLIPRARVNSAHLAGQGRREYLLRVLAEHDSVVVAIANQDPEAARAAMRTHLSNSRERLRRAQEAVEGSLGPVTPKR